MSDKVQVGLRIDREVYEEFKQHVKDRRGRWQGVAGDELENAIRHHIRYGTDKPLPELVAEVNERVQRVEGAVGAAGTDGGTDTFEPSEHTHRPDPTTPDSKPAGKAGTEEKVRWLAAQVLDEHGVYGDPPDQLPVEVLRDVVKTEYGFRSDTAKRYVEQLRDHFGYVEHPNTDRLLVTPEERERILEDAAKDELEDV